MFKYRYFRIIPLRLLKATTHLADRITSPRLCVLVYSVCVYICKSMNARKWIDKLLVLVKLPAHTYIRLELHLFNINQMTL